MVEDELVQPAAVAQVGARLRAPGVAARRVEVAAGDHRPGAVAEHVVEADGDERARRRVAPFAGRRLAQAGAPRRGDERRPLDGILARVAAVGVEGDAVQSAEVARGDRRGDAVRLEHEHAVARDVRRPAREVGAEVGLDVGADDRRAVVGDVGAARHPGAAVGRVPAAVAALVVDEGVHVQPILDRQAVRVERVAHRDRVAGVAAQDEPLDPRRSKRLLRAGDGGLAAVDADHRQRALVEVAAAQRPVLYERVHVYEPAAVVTAGQDDEARLVDERLAVEDAGDDRVGVGEVAPVRDRAGAQVHLVVDVPVAVGVGVAVAVGPVGGGQLASVQVGQAGEHRQVGADEAEVGDEVQAVATGVGPRAGRVDPAERRQQAAGLHAALARRERGPGAVAGEAAGGVEPE